MRRVLEAIVGAGKAGADVLKSQRAAERQALSALLTRFATLKRSLQNRLLSKVTDFKRFNLTALLADVDRMIGDTESALARLAAEELQRSAERGEAAVNEPARSVGIVVAPALPGLDADLVTATFGNTVDLLSIPMKQFGADVKAGIRRVALAGDNKFEELQRLRDKIGGAGFDDAQFKAERIIRTEIGRVFNAAQFDRMNALAANFPFLRKGWRSTKDGRTRTGHREAGTLYARGQGIKIADVFQVKVYDERDGKAPKLIGTASLRFPLDPNAQPSGKIAAGATIMCRCNGFVDFNPAELSAYNAGRVSTAVRGVMPPSAPVPVPQPAPAPAPLPQPPKPKRVRIPKGTQRISPATDALPEKFRTFKSGTEIEKVLGPSAEQWADGPPDDYFANRPIKAYAGTSDSFLINKALRQGKPSTIMAGKIKELQDLLDKASFPEGVQAFRSIDAKSQAEQTAILDHFTKHIGKTIIDKAFVSTSANQGYADNWAKGEHAIKVRVNVPKGAKAAFLPKAYVSRQEWEILIQSGSKFSVVNVSGNTVTLELKS